jgi:uncharacterized protein
MFIHGWRSKQSSPLELTDRLTRAGFTCLTFDLPGHGDSGGDIAQLSRRHYLDACLVVFDSLRAVEGVQRIAIVGSSFGGYLACLVAAQRPLAGLVLRAPANYPDETFEQPQLEISDAIDQLGHKQQQDFPNSRAMVALGMYNGHALLVQPENDEMIDPRTTKRYLEVARQNANLTHRVIPNTGHNFDPKAKAAYGELLVQWLSSVCSLWTSPPANSWSHTA